MRKQVSKEFAIHNLPIYSVSEISNVIKNTIESDFSHVRVRGEVSGSKKATSGHIYFSLKDESFVLDSICWRGTASKLKILPDDGLEIVAMGRLTTYGARSKYQLIVDSIELAGEGALLKLLEERKEKLKKEGVFDQSKKKTLPFLPETIGVVTSPTGAVFRDIIHRLKARFGRHIILWPVPVQGQNAAKNIVEAINGFNSLEPQKNIPTPDIIIIARGGGSLEDLWPFNEETIVRAVAASVIPIISAIGHEVDMTLIDYVSDVRAPTPSAAAEIAVPVRSEILAHALEQGQRKVNAMNRIIRDRILALELAKRGLPKLDRLTENSYQRIDELFERLRHGLLIGIKTQQQLFMPISKRVRFPIKQIEEAEKNLRHENGNLVRAFNQFFRDRRNKLTELSKLLESYSYERVLDRGFAVLQTDNAETIESVTQISENDTVNVILRDGSIVLKAMKIGFNDEKK